MDARRLKEKALQHFQKGKFAKAAEVWAEVCKADPKDMGTRLRLGDALSKAGQADAAFDAYKEAMDGFAKQGFLPQAIAAAKLALVLRPNDFELEQIMLGFSAERLGRPSLGPGPSQVGLPLLDGAPGGYQSSPSGLLGAGARGSRPSAVLPLQAPLVPGPPPMVAAPAPAQVPGPPPMVSAAPAAAPGAPTALRSRRTPVPLAPPAPAEAPVRPPPEAAPDDLTPAPDLPPPAVTPLAPDLGQLEPPTDATLPMLGGRAPRVLPGVRRPDPPPPSREELMSTLVPGSRVSPGAPMVDLHLSSTGADSTVFAVNPFVRSSGSGTRVEPALQRPAPEVAGAEPGRFPRIPLFEDLPAEAFSALVQESPLQVLPAGQVILTQDAEGDDFFVICGGRVRVYREEPTGRRELAILEPGAFFGEMAVLTGARRSAWVVAEVDDTRLLQVSAPTLQRVARAHPSVAQGLLAFARRRILSNVMSSEALFSAFKRNERQDWADRFVPREVELGELLLQPGQPSPGLVVVVSGHLQVSGGGRPPYKAGPGALLGDVELISGTVEVRVQALARCSVLMLAPRDAEALVAHPSNAGRRPALLEAGRRRSGALAPLA